MSLKLKINGDKTDLSMIIISAARYALGRKTYIVQWTCEFIKNNINLLIEKDLYVMLHDINQQEKSYGLGDNCDIECWHSLRRKLEEEIYERNN